MPPVKPTQTGSKRADRVARSFREEENVSDLNGISELAREEKNCWERRHHLHKITRKERLRLER